MFIGFVEALADRNAGTFGDDGAKGTSMTRHGAVCLLMPRAGSPKAPNVPAWPAPGRGDTD